MSFRSRIRVAVAALAVVFCAPAFAQIPQTEHDALVALFNSTGGNAWIDKTGWNGAAGTECSWFGVQCDDSAAHVIGLQLGNNNLSGTLPSFAGLPALQSFLVPENQLTGTIPALAGLTDLQHFYVQNNQLIGTIPVLTGLTNLQEFYVQGNQLTGSIPAISGLTSLTTFDVDTNQLTGLIPSPSGLANLFIFDVESNQLSGTLPALASLPSLAVFAADANSLNGTIPSLSGLPALQGFSAGYNALTGSLPALSGLANLSYFNVSSNQLQGSIPALTNLPGLMIFDVSFNQLNGSIPALGGLTNLQQMYLGFNDLNGPIPALAGLVNLQDFVVGNNRLSGSIPALSGLTNLQAFNVGNNKIDGEIPALAGLVNLQSFYADSDLLTGSIPELAGLTNLTTFSVPRNGLNGTIPSLAGLAKLVQFDASFNQLSGPIPALNGLAQLQLVYLGFNLLSGPIPPLAGLGNLQQFIVDDNQLSQSIPALSGLGNLQDFNAGNNQLSGLIPSLAGLGSLAYFSVTSNQLTGAIPALSGLANLGLFDASYNQLSGTIPALTGLGNLQVFYLGFNQLTGSIPTLAGLGSLQIFAVDDNQLSASIPALNGLGNLQEFLAANNELTGTLPALTGLGNLQTFEVGNNRLTGRIPAVPAPDNLSSGLSSLCPNALIVTDDTGWDDATGLVPWYSTCAAAESTTANDAPTDKNSTQIALSNDGSIKVFQSQETDLVTGNANTNGQDIYSVGADGQAELEDIDDSGHQLIGTASQPAISPDGNVIAFLFTPTAAVNAKDLATGQMFAGGRGQPKHQVDIGMGSVPPNGPASGAPSLSSANGVNQLVFCSSASNLVPADGNSARDIFLVDPMNAAVAAQRVSVDGAGEELPGDSCEPKLSGDGTKVVFSLSAPSLYSSPARQIVRKDLGSPAKILLTGSILPITTSPTGQGAAADSSEPTINQDGSVIVFTSQANLDGLAPPLDREVFVSLAQAGGNRLIKRMRSDSSAVAGFATSRPQLSADGTTVVMQASQATFFSSKSLAKADVGTVANQCGTVAITTNFFSVTPLGGTLCSSNGSTVNANPSISGDGITTGFDSNAPQGNGNINRNTYSQGVGVNMDVTGNSVPNLSGDFSGQWFDPSQSGQGVVIDVTNPDANNSRLMVLTWFVFSNGQSTWVQGVGVPKAGNGSAANTVVVQMDQVAIVQGVSFPLGEAQATPKLWGSITLTLTDANTGVMNWASSYPGFNSGSMPIKHFLSVDLPTQDASSAQIKACYSGNWFNPAQIGHGFEFEILPTTPALLAVDWFAFSPSGAPVWLQGVGPISGNHAQIQLQLIDGAGAQFPPNFDPGRITQHVWGTATFTFADSAHATVSWSSTIPGYGSGTQPLQPLATGLLDRRGCQ
jgi:Leucine-rich repeat (LRR) protein